VPSRRDALAAAALCLLVGIAFFPVLRNGFADVDDPDYVTANAHVRAGLTAGGAVWAFTTTEAANWHPLTWLSHMADVAVFGLDPRGHHATSVALHAASTALLFLALLGMTGRRALSWIAAALFGVHPLRVESVAWIAERKDVLSAFFAMAALLAYAAFAAKPGRGRLATVAALTALGLLAKPMLVTLPVVLLLLDFWPLGRLRVPSDLRARVVEKLPLFALAAASSIVTVIAQRLGHAVESLQILPLGARIENAVVACTIYLQQTVWPSRLAFFYPHAWTTGGSDLEGVRVAGSAAALIVISAIAVRVRRRCPYFPVAWGWYLGMLVPVLGIVQVGAQAHADRYTYLPLVGPVVAAVWGVAALVTAGGRAARTIAVAAAAAAIGVLALRTRAQIETWHDPARLYAQAIANTEKNYVAHLLLGVVAARQGRLDDAIGHFEESVRLVPGYAEGEDNLGSALLRMGRTQEALPHFLVAVEHGPQDPQIRNDLGQALIAAGRLADGTRQLQEALRLSPNYATAHFNLAMALGRQRRFEEALAHFDAAVALAPERAEAWANRGLLLQMIGRKPEAIADYRRALSLRPDWPEVAAALADAER
jgi:Flp pilus assembly protein TadD